MISNPSATIAPALLLGASGFLGPALIEAFGPGGALATHNRHARPGSLYFDARETTVASLLPGLERKPATAIILLGITGIDDCARDPKGTAAVNVQGVIRVIDEVRALGITPVFVSSDGVFDGSRAMWREDDAPNPILEYGRQKVAVEQYLRALPPPWLIVRPPKLLDPAPNPRCMLTGWLKALGEDKEILCATDQYFTPAAAPDVARALALLVRQGAEGLYHLGGPRRLSRRDLLEAVVDEYRRHAEPRAQIVNCSLRDIKVLEPRPLDASLDSSRFAQAFASRFGDPAAVAQAAAHAFFRAKNEPGSAT
jgi:dTDP-4-dehydrorhamnose reductase